VPLGERQHSVKSGHRTVYLVLYSFETLIMPVEMGLVEFLLEVWQFRTNLGKFLSTQPRSAEDRTDLVLNPRSSAS